MRKNLFRVPYGVRFEPAGSDAVFSNFDTLHAPPYWVFWQDVTEIFLIGQDFAPAWYTIERKK